MICWDVAVEIQGLLARGFPPEKVATMVDVALRSVKFVAAGRVDTTPRYGWDSTQRCYIPSPEEIARRCVRLQKEAAGGEAGDRETRHGDRAAQPR